MAILTRPRGRLLVIGGHSRGVGKTSVGSGLIRALTRTGHSWSAVKVSSHRHHIEDPAFQPQLEVAAPSDTTQAGRYLLAGASSAFLLRSPDAFLAAAAELLESLLARGHNLLVESNRLATILPPDLVIFVTDPANSDWKSSSDACLSQAHALIIAGSADPTSYPPSCSAYAIPHFAVDRATWGSAPLSQWAISHFSRSGPDSQT